ncbi:MAG: hypothetical protein K5695_05840 [Oscillospiraceae bacterium]|nr:hypothetical protein [Oscillospiraceae bacterium]
MKKTAKQLLKQYWIVLWIIVASLSLVTVGVTYASYNKTSTARSVVARVGAVGKHFSSNYLQQGTAMTDVPLYVKENDTEPGGYVRISNFPQGNPGDAYYRQINYVLKMRLVYYNEADSQYVRAANNVVGDRYVNVIFNEGTTEESTYTLGKDGDGYSNVSSDLEISSLLLGNVSSTDTFRLIYSADQVAALSEEAELPQLPKLYLEIEAVPTPAASYLDLETLKGRIDLRLNDEVDPVTWNGYFNDTGAKDAEDGTAVSETLEGFNYVIEGVGNGTITLTWDTNYLSLNKDFINAVGASPSVSDGIATLVFSVDSNNTSRYDTQFYCTETYGNTWCTNWGTVRSKVTCTFA